MKKNIKWLIVCIIVFLLSVFAHECGHGLANAIAGIPCSTGFNRVGDIYKYPQADNFREFYSTADPVLLDFGVPCTIVLAVVGTILFMISKREKIQYFGAAIAIENCLLRLLPCSLVLLIPLITGNAHVEDEYETGSLLVQLTNNNMWLYVPAITTFAIMIICLILIIRTTIKRKIDHKAILITMSVLANFIGFAMAFILDNFIRINWKPI